MATISNTQSIPNPGFNPWTSKVELDTSTGNQTVYVYGGSGRLLYNGTPQEELVRYLIFLLIRLIQLFLMG